MWFALGSDFSSPFWPSSPLRRNREREQGRLLLAGLLAGVSFAAAACFLSHPPSWATNQGAVIHIGNSFCQPFVHVLQVLTQWWLHVVLAQTWSHDPHSLLHCPGQVPLAQVGGGMPGSPAGRFLISEIVISTHPQSNIKSLLLK